MISRISSGSPRADIAVEPTRSQNHTGTWRRSATSWAGGVGVALVAFAEVSAASRLAIAFSRRLRWPIGTPSFSRPLSARSARTAASILFSRNSASYLPRPRLRSQSPTAILVPQSPADLVDRGAGREIDDHRLRHRGGIERDAMRDDAVIAGENSDQRRVDMRRAALPGGEKFADLLQPAERSGRLGQLRLALTRGREGRRIRRRHPLQKSADIVERTGRGGHRNALGSTRTRLEQNRSEGKRGAPPRGRGPAPRT